MVEPFGYAVSWAQGGARFVGHALLTGRSLRLEGRDAGSREGRRTVRYDEVASLDIKRTNGDRSLVLELVGHDRLVISSLDRPGSLGELADRLRGLTGSPQR